jgi:hypothetical protein
MMLTLKPEFSVFMPCTLSLYEENGKTIISTMNMKIMLKAVKKDKTLFTGASSLYNSFKKMMNSLATNSPVKLLSLNQAKKKKYPDRMKQNRKSVFCRNHK